MATTDLGDTIAAVAANPARVKTPDLEVEARDLGQLVEADKHLAKKAAGKSRSGGLRFTQIVNPGTV